MIGGALSIGFGAMLDVEDNPTLGDAATLDGVTVQNSGTIQVDLNFGATLLLDDGTAVNGGSVQINQFGTLEVASGSGVGPDYGATFDGVTVTDQGAFSIDSGANLTISHTSGTTTSISSGSAATSTIDNSGTIEVAGGATLALSGIEISDTGSGNITVDSGATLTVGSKSFTTPSSGTMTASGATFDGGTITNSGGAIEISGPTTVDDGATVSGAITVETVSDAHA